jgi:hypothetical protein
MLNLDSNISSVLRSTRASFSKAKINEFTAKAINDTITKSKTTAAKEIRAEGYMLSASKIKARLEIKRASASLKVGTLKAMGRRVNLFEYGARQVGKSALQRDSQGRLSVKTGGGVSVLVKRSRKLIKHAFIVKGKVYIRADYLRSNRSTFATSSLSFSKGFTLRESDIKQLTGPGVPTMLANDVVMRVLTRDAPIHFTQRLFHYVRRSMASAL